jgi:D-alanyl-D-alanine carboxypeptidase/D-alanyl-D-alanine-endopeptidase (penicillin-binding protein 4)
LTAASALAIFGPSHRFATRIETLHPIVDHRLVDNLWLVGGGDPVFSSDDLRGGIKALSMQGLRQINGRVLVDASAFNGPAQNPHWALDDLNLDYAAGTSSISLDEDVAIFSVQPTSIGAPAQVHLLPANAAAVLTGSIMTGYTSNVRIDHKEGSNQFILSGTIAQGIEQRFPIPMGDVPHFVGGIADAMLRARGITTIGKADIGFAPIGGQTLWMHRSPPLAQIVHHMLVVSDNHVAEQLLRLLGTSAHRSGTEAAGIAVERAFLSRIGVKNAGLQIYDGSGLAPSDRIAPMTLASVLADAGARPGSPLILGLPRVGIEGTVAGHTLKAAAGRVRAKSGHISGVDGLVGVVKTRRHGLVTFAFIANDADDATVEDAEDKVLDAISKY